MNSIRELDLRWLALAGGIGYALAVTLIATQADTDPVGTSYDAFNRVLGVALALVAGSAFALRDRIRIEGRPGARAATALAIGLAAMALGSVVEFWGSLVAGEPASATADRTGEDAFAGADVGFAFFAIGSLVAFVAALVLARAVRGWLGSGRTTAIAAGSVGALNVAAFGLWTVSPLAAAIAGVLFAFAWLTVAAGAEQAGDPAAQPA